MSVEVMTPEDFETLMIEAKENSLPLREAIQIAGEILGEFGYGNGAEQLIELLNELL